MSEKPMSVDCIMLAYTKNAGIEHMTRQAIDSFHAAEPAGQFDLALTLVETSHDTTIAYPGARMVFPKLPFNYNQFLNIGLTHARGADFTVIANNDLIFHEGWLSTLIAAMDAHGLDSASPVSTKFPPHAFVAEHQAILTGYGANSYVCGWCLVFRRATLERITPFDEDFDFWYQDDVISRDLEEAGLVHGLIGTSHVTHLEHGSYCLLSEEELMRMTLESRELYLRKMAERDGAREAAGDSTPAG